MLMLAHGVVVKSRDNWSGFTVYQYVRAGVGSNNTVTTPLITTKK